MKKAGTKSRKNVKHRYKVGDMVRIRVTKDLAFYGRVKKLRRIGAADEPAYEITGFGDPVIQDKHMTKSRKKSL